MNRRDFMQAIPAVGLGMTHPGQTIIENKVVCEECQKAGKKSTVVYKMPVAVPAVYIAPPEEFWDEDGNRHVHDREFTARHNLCRGWYECSNGHTWPEPLPDLPKCWCGWPDDGPYVKKKAEE